MKKLLAILLAALMLAGCCAVFASCGGDEDLDRVVTVENKVIKVGVIGPFTGGVAQYGVAVRNATRLAVKEINASTAILNGYTIELVELDDMGDATKGAANFTVLEEQDIAALMGPVTTGVTMAVTSLANEYGVVMMTPTATGNNVTTASDYVFRSCFKDAYQGTLAARHAKTLGKTEVAVLYATGDDYSKGLYEAFVAECQVLGITVKTTQTSATIDKETSFSTQLAAVKSAVGADGFLFAPYYYGAMATMVIPQARQAGFTGVIMGSDGYDGICDKTVGSDLSIYENVVFTNHYDAESTDTNIVNFRTAYAADNNGEAPNAFAALAYDGMYMLAKALEKAVKVDGETVTISGADVKANLDGMEYTGVTGTIKLDATGTPEKSAVITEFYADGTVLKMRTWKNQ